jgi:hypothetical protein
MEATARIERLERRVRALTAALILVSTAQMIGTPGLRAKVDNDDAASLIPSVSSVRRMKRAQP